MRIFILCITLLVSVCVKGQYASIEKADFSEYFDVDEINVDEEWPGCLSDEYLYFYRSLNNPTKMSFTYADPTTQESNNSIYQPYLNGYIRFVLLGPDGVEYFIETDKTLNEIIDINSSTGTIFECTTPMNDSSFGYRFQRVEITDYGKCNDVGSITCENYRHWISDANPDSNLINENLDDHNCSNPDLACDFTANILAEEEGNDLNLSCINLTTDEVMDIAGGDIDNIQFQITGFTGSQSETQTVMFFDKDWPNFEAETWSETLFNFSGHTDYVIQAIVELTTGEILSCNTADLEINTNSQVCDILTTLNYHYENEVLTFNYLEEGENYLKNAMQSIGLQLSAAEGILDANVSTLTFILSYSNGGPYEQQSSVITNVSAIDLIDIETSFPDIDAEFFDGSLEIIYQDSEGNFSSCYLQPINITAAGSDNDLPTYECGDSYELPVITNQTNIANLLIGDLIESAGFIVQITEVTTTGNSHTGVGLINLPFTSKPLIVTFSNIKVNTDKEVYQGTIRGKSLSPSEFPDFAINPEPLVFGGDICLPPALENDLNDDNISTATGLDPNGFDENGYYNGTDSKLDDNGFDKDGNYKDTGKPYNDNYCSRDGFKYEENENGEYVKTTTPCDVTGSDDPVVTDFLDSIATGFPSLVDQSVDDFLSTLIDSLANLDCGGIRTEMTTLVGQLPAEIDATFITGESNEYINEGMSGHFVSPPKPSTLNSNLRSETIVNIENTHVDLFRCDKKMTILKEFEQVLENIPMDKLLLYLEEQLESVTKTQVEDFKTNPYLFIAWIELQLQNFVDESLGIGAVEINQHSPDLFDVGTRQSAYHSLADINGGFMIMDEASIREENNWLFHQGFEDINGVDRALYLEELWNRNEVVGGGTEGAALLPLKLDKFIDGSSYDIYLSNLTLTPQGAKLDAHFIFIEPGSGKKIVLKATNLTFGKGGIIGESKLSLASPIEIRLNNSALMRIVNSENTYVAWDCTGFTSIGVDFEIEFCENIIVPINPTDNSVIPDTRYTLSSTLVLDSWSDFFISFNQNGLAPFAMANNDKYVFTVNNIIVDFSDKQSPLSGMPPPEYSSPHVNNGQFLNSWRGFYIGQLSVMLPNTFSSDDDATVTTGVQDLIVDGNGISTLVFAEDLLDISSGNASGWPISIDRLELLILKNNIKGGGLGGELGIPILDNPLEYTASIYGQNNMVFTMSPTGPNDIDMMLATATIDQNSIVEAAYIDGEFDFLATLNGSVEIGGENLEIPITVPKATFKNLQVGNKEPYFSPGSWSIANNVSIGFNGFDANFRNIKFQQTEDNDPGKAALAFDIDLELVKALNLKAGGSFELIGALDIDAQGRQDWGYESTKVNSFHIDAEFTAGHIRGSITRFAKDNKYGKGFAGAVDMKFKSLGEITALGMFGNTSYGHDESYKYFFVDAKAELNGTGIPAGPLSITGFAGGLSYHMLPDYEDLSISNPTPSAPPIGASLSGVQYDPDVDIGLGFKAGVLLELAGSDAMKGSASLSMFFNSTEGGGGLNSLAFDGYAQFMSKAALGLKPTPTSKDTKPTGIDAAMSAYLSLNYNFQLKELHGKFKTFLATEGDVLTGSGDNRLMVDAEAHFGPDKWYINVGVPDNRCGINMNIPGISSTGIKLETYFNIGTSVPDMPPIPNNVREIASTIRPNTTLRNSGAGFVFGASLDVNSELDFGIGKGTFDAGLGFDVMVRDFGDAYCSGDLPADKIGFDGWYAMGQVWAYIQGSLEILGYNVFEAGIAAALQAQLPNPFFARADLGIKINTALGGIDYTANVKLGEQCEIISNDPESIGMDVISIVLAADGTKDIEPDFRPEILFNAPVNSTFEIADINGNLVEFEIVLKDVDISSSYGEVYHTVELSEGKTSATIVPNDMFYAGDSVEMTVSVDIFKNSVLLTTETRYTKFYIGSEYTRIPENNIAYTYPVNGMFNFYKNEYNEQAGYVQLNNGMPELFLGLEDGMQLKARLSRNNGTQYVYDCNYDISQRRLDFPLPPDHLEAGIAYKLEIMLLRDGTYQEHVVGDGLDYSQPFGGGSASDYTSAPGVSGGETVEDASNPDSRSLHSIYFRVSEYPTLGNKLNVLQQSSSGGLSGIQGVISKTAAIEPFDNVDRSLMSFNVSSNTWTNKYKNLYELPLPYSIIDFIDGCLYKTEFKKELNSMINISPTANAIEMNITTSKYQYGWDQPQQLATLMNNVEVNTQQLLNNFKKSVDGCLLNASDNPEYNGTTNAKLLEYLGEKVYNIYTRPFETMPIGNYPIEVHYTIPGDTKIRLDKLTFTKN